MTDGATLPTTGCPPWCQEAPWGHVPEADGRVHHDSAVRALELSDQDGPVYLMVSATRRDPDGGSVIALSDDSRTLARMTAAEAARLAQLLAETARLLIVEGQLGDPANPT